MRVDETSVRETVRRSGRDDGGGETRLGRVREQNLQPFISGFNDDLAFSRKWVSGTSEEF